MIRVTKRRGIVYLLSAALLVTTAWFGRSVYLCHLWNVVWDLRYDDLDRNLAMHKITDIHPEDCASQIEKLIESGTDGQVKHAFAALLRLGKKAGRPVLEHLVKDGSTRSRLNAARAVRGSADPADLALLRALLNDVDPDVQLQAHYSLLSAGDVTAVPGLIDALRWPPDSIIVCKAHFALEKAFPGHRENRMRFYIPTEEYHKHWADWWSRNREKAVVSPDMKQGESPPWPDDIMHMR